MAPDNRPRGRVAGSGWARLAALLHGPDLRIAGILLAVCAALFAITTTFDSVPLILDQTIPASWFPRLLILSIVIFTLILPIEHLFSEQGKQKLDADRKARIEPISLLTAALLILVVLVGWPLGTTLTIALVCLLLPLLWGQRLSWRLLLFVIVFPTLVTLVFTQLLQVYFDPGLLARLLR